jgi:hypothetical protein
VISLAAAEICPFLNLSRSSGMSYPGLIALISSF